MQPPPTPNSPNPTKVILVMGVMCCALGVLLQVERAEQIIALVLIPSGALHVLSAIRLKAGQPPLPLFNGVSPQAHLWFAATSTSMALVVFAGARLPMAVLWSLVVFSVASIFLASKAERLARAQL